MNPSIISRSPFSTEPTSQSVLPPASKSFDPEVVEVVLAFEQVVETRQFGTLIVAGISGRFKYRNHAANTPSAASQKTGAMTECVKRPHDCRASHNPKHIMCRANDNGVAEEVHRTRTGPTVYHPITADGIASRMSGTQ